MRSSRWFCQKQRPSATPNAASERMMRVRSSSRCSTRLSRSSCPIGRMRLGTTRGVRKPLAGVSRVCGSPRTLVVRGGGRDLRGGLGPRLLELGLVVLVLPGDRVLELAHAPPERASQVGQALRSEDQKHDYEDDDDLEWPDVGHGSSSRYWTVPW